MPNLFNPKWLPETGVSPVVLSSIGTSIEIGFNIRIPVILVFTETLFNCKTDSLPFAKKIFIVKLKVYAYESATLFVYFSFCMFIGM